MFKFHKIANSSIAELTDNKILIAGTQDTLDVFGELIPYNCNRIIIREENFHPAFFDLKTGIAGDILQKFSNYQIKLAIVGDFSKYKSKSLQDFIRECNRGKMIFFLDNLDEALNKLG